MADADAERALITAVIERWLGAVVSGPVEILDELFAGDATESKARAAAVRDALEDLEGRIDDLVIEAPTVAWRWTVSGRHVGALAGVPPSGERVEIRGVNFQRVDDGQVIEHWTTVDVSGLARP